jgi:hypothetical protein
MRKVKLPRRTVPACVVVIIEDGRRRARRWRCESCDESGDWTTPDDARAGGETHVERVRERAKVAP